MAGSRWSNDPRGTLAANLLGTTEPLVPATDLFSQVLIDWTADILFTVDQSGSMLDDQTLLSDNFAGFLSELAGKEIDYQVMVSTRDDGCHNESILTPDTPNPAQVFEEAVVSADYGVYTEAGLTIALNALSQTDVGACNAGFLRPSSNTILVLISDEPEQSANTWDWYVDRILLLAPSARINVVVTIVPCGDGAEGTGYFEAAIATGGTIFDICDESWATDLASVVEVEEPFREFALSSLPLESSIEVLVNGDISLDWLYDPVLNAVAFVDEAIPPAASVIEVRYDLLPDCAAGIGSGC